MFWRHGPHLLKDIVEIRVGHNTSISSLLEVQNPDLKKKKPPNLACTAYLCNFFFVLNSLAPKGKQLD